MAQLLKPSDATNEGSRRVRELLLKIHASTIARRLRCDESSIRHYAREQRKPTPIMRQRWFEAYGWPLDVWDSAPSSDTYVNEPPTTRAAQDART